MRQRIWTVSVVLVAAVVAGCGSPDVPGAEQAPGVRRVLAQVKGVT